MFFLVLAISKYEPQIVFIVNYRLMMHFSYLFDSIFPNEIDVVMTLHFLLHTCKLSGLRPKSASCNCNLKFARLVVYIGASIWTPTSYVLMLIWVLHVCQSFGYICMINADVLWCIWSWLWILHFPELLDVKQIDIFLHSHFGGLSPFRSPSQINDSQGVGLKIGKFQLSWLVFLNCVSISRPSGTEGFTIVVHYNHLQNYTKKCQ